MDRLLAAGALDVFYTPVQMKKNRPGTLLTVIARAGARAALIAIVFRETTTIGVRYRECERECLDREIVTVDDAVGPMRFKVARRDGASLNAAPEFDDCVRLARRARLPVKDVQALASRPGAIARAFTERPLMPRFYLTTAIDYVNSRPHLGHRLREDHGRRHRPLQAAARVRDAFPDGQRRALAERLQAGAASRALDPLAYCDRMEQEFRAVWEPLDCSYDDFIRTTQPRHKAGGAGDGAGGLPTTATSTRASTKAGTASAARRSSRRRISSTASARCTDARRSGSRRRTTSSGCRSTSEPLLDHFNAHPEFVEPDIRRNEILRLLECGAR